MSGFKEYDKYDALGLARLVQQRKVKPVELCEEAISRIEMINPTLNAVVTRMYDEALETAKGTVPKGPFSGVPFLLKDLIQAYAGIRLTSSCRAMKDYVPAEDSEVVRRFKEAGLIVVGKTNTPELGLMGITEPELFGPTRNPWNTEHTPGGSSGGSAAAVAGGMVPAASGNDGGGSIRIPSACCGLFGLKPSRGRVPAGPESRELWQGAAIDHALTRSVRDSAALLDCLQGADVGAPYIIKPPERPYLDETRRKPGKLRIAFTLRPFVSTPVHPACVTAVEKTVKLLKKLGHRVEEGAPAIDSDALAKSFSIMAFGETAAEVDHMKKLLGRRVRRNELEPLTRVSKLLGQAYSASDFVKALQQWNEVTRTVGSFHRTYDCLLTPTQPYPPVRIGELMPKPAERAAMKVVNALRLGRLLKISGIVDLMAAATFSSVAFTFLANVTGQPAMSVPLHWTEDNLPCGVQFIGRYGDEATLFRLAAQLEKAMPWFDRRAPELT